MVKLPSFQFYPGDWAKDPSLRRCSAAARGFWVDVLCLMFECEDRGVLSTGGVPWTDDEVSAAVSGDTTANLALLNELLLKGVCFRNQSGAIFSKRMTRDESIRRERVKAGHEGGKQNGSKFKAKRKAKSKQKPEGEEEDETEAFEMFWNLFPSVRKRNKSRAREAFSKAVRKKSAIEIVRATKEYAESDQGRGKYAQMPETWLNGECWEDDRAAWRDRRDPRGNLALLDKYTTEGGNEVIDEAS